MGKNIYILPFLLTLVSPAFSQTNESAMVTSIKKSPIDANFLAEYLMWGDRRIVAILEKLSEEDFNKPFNELSGNIHSKTAHILSIYEFFIAVLEGRSYNSFPDFGDLSKEDLISKWKEIIGVWPRKVEEIQNGLYALPLANNQRVEVRHIYFDALTHAIHHRGQLLTFIRLLGKDKEEVHPSDTNVDYLMYLFKEHQQLIHEP